MNDLGIKCDFIYGTKKFIPPVFYIWKRSWLGKWTQLATTENPVDWANKGVLIVSGMGMLIGTEDLIEAWKKQPPDERSDNLL